MVISDLDVRPAHLPDVPTSRLPRCFLVLNAPGLYPRCCRSLTAGGIGRTFPTREIMSSTRAAIDRQYSVYFFCDQPCASDSALLTRPDFMVGYTDGIREVVTRT